MASRLYPKFLDLVRRWPEEPNSIEKHLGKVLRAIVAQRYPQGSISKVENEQSLTPVFEAFNNLSNGVHLKRYPRQFTSSATGIKREDIADASISDVFEVLRVRAQGAGGTLRYTNDSLKFSIKSLLDRKK